MSARDRHRRPSARRTRKRPNAPPPLPPDPLEEARAALARGAWEEARDRFRRQLKTAPSPEAWEGLAVATSYLDDAAALDGLPTAPNAGGDPYAMFAGTPLARVTFPTRSGYARPDTARPPVRPVKQ